MAVRETILVVKWTNRLEEEQVDGDDEGSEPAAHLEHLPAFTERWVPEALTSHVLSQVLDTKEEARLVALPLCNVG